MGIIQMSRRFALEVDPRASRVWLSNHIKYSPQNSGRTSYESYGYGSKLKPTRGPQVLVDVSTYQGNPFWGTNSCLTHSK